MLITLKNCLIKFEDIKKTDSKNIVDEVTVKHSAENTEICFGLREGYLSHEIVNSDEGKTLLLTIRNKAFERKAKSEKKGKWEFDVIVIDAGHGGKDYGAIGLNGIREKDVNLSVALKLGKLIEANVKGVKVVYTRKDDRFIELYKRGKIANESNGKLFISIHCCVSSNMAYNDCLSSMTLGRTKNSLVWISVLIIDCCCRYRNSTGVVFSATPSK